MSLNETIICKNCGHRLYRKEDGTFEHYNRFYDKTSKRIHSKECNAEHSYQDIFDQPTYCGCRKPEPKQKVLDLTLDYKKELELSLTNGVTKFEKIFIARIMDSIKDNLEILEG